MPHLTVDMNQVHKLFRLQAISAHFTLLFGEAQLKNTKAKRHDVNMRREYGSWINTVRFQTH